MNSQSHSFSKRGLPLIVALLFSLAAVAQTTISRRDSLYLARTAPTLSRANDTSALNFFVEADDEAMAAIERSGATILYRTGSCAAVSAPRALLPGIAATSGVKHVTLSRRTYLANQRSKNVTGADKMNAGQDLPQGFDGKGVMVGVVDIGIDINHINFQTPDGDLRIPRLWRVDTDTATSVTTVIEYPTERDFADYTPTPDEMHGTHTLGTLSGSYVDSEANAPDYRGVAYGATPIACESSLLSDADIVVGVGRMVDYALTEGKPVVVSLSLASLSGPRDPNNPMCRMLDSIAAPPSVNVLLAAGNSGGEPTAAVKHLEDGDETMRVSFQPVFFNWYYHPGDPYTMEDEVAVWANDDQPLEAWLELYDVYSPNPEQPVASYPIPQDDILTLGPGDDEMFDKVYGDNFKMVAFREVDAMTGRYVVMVVPTVVGTITDANFRYATAIRAEGHPGQTLRAYTIGASIGMANFRDHKSTLFESPTRDGTISSMACGLNTICIGAIDSSDEEANLETVYFSSYGTLDDGRVLPDVSAPGVNVISSMSSDFLNSEEYDPEEYPTSYSVNRDGKEYLWTLLSGTSMSCPHAAGIVAAWVSANPDLTTEDIRDIAHQTATPLDQYAGAGIINAYEGVKLALQRVGIVAPTDNEEARWLHAMGQGMFEAFDASRPSFTAEVFDIAGRRVMMAMANSNTATIDISQLPIGIYIIRTPWSAYKVTNR